MGVEFRDSTPRELVGNESLNNSQAPYRPFRALSLKKGKDLENNDHEKIFNLL